MDPFMPDGHAIVSMAGFALFVSGGLCCAMNRVPAMARLEHLRTHGDSDHAFGWDFLRAAAGRENAADAAS